MTDQPALGIDPKMRRKTAAVLAGSQRADAVGQGFGQHRDDAIGEIATVAAPIGLAVQRRAGPHIVGDVGDGDDQVPTAAIGRVAVRRRPHRVVEVARIGAVNGDQRDIAQVGAVGQAGHGHGRRFVEGRRRKLGRNPGTVERDQTDGPGVRRIAQPVDDHAAARAVLDARPGRQLGDHQFAVFGAMAVGLGDQQRVLAALVGGLDLPAGAPVAVHADDPAAGHRRAKPLDGPAFITVVAQPPQPRQHPVAFGQGRVTAAFRRHVDRRRRRLGVPTGRPGHHLAIRVDGLDHQDGDLAERLGRCHPATAAALDQAFRLDLLDQRLQRHPVGTGDLEGAGDLPLAHRGRAAADEIDHLLLGGKRCRR